MSFITSRRKSRETIGVSGVLALVLSPLVVAATAAPASAADPDVLVSTDFEDGTVPAVWQQSGGPTLTVVDDEGGKVLEIADRAENFDGIQTALGAIEFEHDVTYTFSFRAKLAADAGGPYEMRAVVKPHYGWVGNAAVSSEEWTTLSGSFTVPADRDPADVQLYIGTSPDSGATYTYYVDDLLLTRPASGPATIVSTDFEDDSFAPWTPRGPVTLAIAAEGHDSAKSMLVSGRADGWHGPQIPVGSLITEGTYQISGWVKLPAGTEGTTEINFGMQQPGASNEYPWVGGRLEVGADEWVELSGSYTVDSEHPPTNLYIESASQTQSFLVDDVLVLGPPSDAWTPTPDPDFVPGGAVGISQTPVSAARGTGDVAALTFDDGPNGAATTELLDFLAGEDVAATFCVIGQNIEAPGGAEILQRIVADGHTLCNHSTSYADMGAMSHTQVENDLKANLEIIRTALGDPEAQVPYFRAPNGSWGVTGEVAAALGMQPLGLGNVIVDWDNPQPDVETLEDNLRAAITPGAVVLVHDGGGDRTNSIAAVKNVIPEFLADGWTFTLPRGGAPVGAYTQTFDFEDGTLQGWVPRATAEGAATVEVTDTEAHDGSTYAATVTDRVHQGQGIGYVVSDVFQAGVTYDISAWLRFAEGEVPGNVWLSIAQTVGGSTSYGTVAQFSGMSNSGWVQVEAALTMPNVDEGLLYFETAYAGGDPGNTSTFLVDDVVFSARVPGEIQDLTPLKDTVDFPVGVAIDSRETLGAPSELLLRHFDQVTPENHMKPEAFYDAAGNFQVHPQATAIMDYAQANDLRVYGHVLVWHSQTPDWFFQDDEGEFLTNSEDDKAELRDRMRTHIRNVAAAFADEYGLYGSDTNPLAAWDVVNEVVNDGTQYADGLRRSLWYNILGEEYIHLAFEYAEEFFNGEFAAEGSDRPVKLFINDYNTEQSGKQQRYFDLVNRMLDAETPLDGVGHQFHVNLAMPTSALEAAIVKFQGLGLKQAVTELDVVVGSASEARLIDQGHYYQRAFEIFRTYADELEAVTVWGLTDGRSWRAGNNGQPLLFDDDLQAKHAYFGAADSPELADPIRSANVFAADVTSATTGPDALEWRKLPLHDIDGDSAFQLRWSVGQLTAYVRVVDGSVDAGDGVTFEYEGQTKTFLRDGTGTATGVVQPTDDGYVVVVDLPLASAPTEGSTASFDVRVADGGTVTGWNSPGNLGVLDLVEPLSYLEAARATQAPQIDGVVDGVWASAGTVKTEKFTSGSSGATAEVKTLWRDETLYVLAEVTDPVVDVSGSDPWVQDSVEIYLDAGNVKNGSYRYDDTQIRISAENVLSFGSGGDEAFQRARVVSQTAGTATGYRVEAAISLLEYGGLGTFHGLDYQVNDASNGVRTSISNWADPTGAGYQNTGHWGVAQLVETVDVGEPGEPGEPDPVDVAPKITLHPKSVVAKVSKVVTLKAAATGKPAPKVQWQKRAAGKTAWTSIKGATSTSLRVKNTKAASGSSYRAVFTNAAGKATTKAAKVSVKPTKAKVTLHPKSAKKVKAGTKVKLRVKATGDFPAAKVGWEQRKPGSKKWTKVKGAAKSTLTVVASHQTDGARYRAVFTNTAGKVRTKAATITVRDGVPAFVSQPRNASVRSGKAATFTAVVAASPRAKFQWFSKTPGSRTWVAVKGAKGATLKVRGAKARTGTTYVLIATNAKGWTSSKVVRLTVKR